MIKTKKEMNEAIKWYTDNAHAHQFDMYKGLNHLARSISVYLQVRMKGTKVWGIRFIKHDTRNRLSFELHYPNGETVHADSKAELYEIMSNEKNNA